MIVLSNNTRDGRLKVTASASATPMKRAEMSPITPGSRGTILRAGPSGAVVAALPESAALQDVRPTVSADVPVSAGAVAASAQSSGAAAAAAQNALLLDAHDRAGKRAGN